MPESGTKFSLDFKLAKVDEDHGLVFGWGIVCNENGQPYFDRQGEHIPEAVMFKAAIEFSLAANGMDDSHNEVHSGEVRFQFPMTKEVQEAYGIECSRTGWLICAAPDEEFLAKYASGEYTGFSIGGWVRESHEVAA